jgi:hypothetical protein
LEACISSLPDRRTRQRPGMEIKASSFKLRANAPEGRKAISYQLIPDAAKRLIADLEVKG